ncbi:MAG: CHAD domain-containing protein [Devosia sp.]|nr:CHAD domain-containing protein [Devosia sp.]
MPLRFQRRRAVAESIRRIATAQIDAALAVIGDSTVDEAEAVHAVRQHLKRLRALIRLPRANLAGFRGENIAFRDLGRKLAHTRDADVLGRTFDKLAASENLPEAADLRHSLLATAGAAMPSSERRALLRGEVAKGLVAARRRVKHWRFKRSGFALIGPGLKRVYRDMRAGEELAADQPTATHFHEWRKQAKYHTDQLALLEAVAPEIFEGYHQTALKLGSTLGKHHDLDVMASALAGLDLPEERRTALLAAIDRRNAKLEATAFRLGLELSAERPADFARRVQVSWKSWRHPKRRPSALPLPPA